MVALNPQIGSSGEWFNRPDCGCFDDCCCRVECAVTLPGPVACVTEVKLGGQVVPPSAYRMLENDLVRIDGGCWPDCQQLGLPDTQSGTWSVTYQRGREVPPGGQAAVTALAVELWKSCNGQRNCRLPQRVEEINREGITYTMVNNDLDVIGALPEVSSWVRLVNPRGQKTPSGVWTPDLPAHRSETRGGNWW